MVNKYLNKLQGQRVLLVGGTSGIGYGIAEASIENGATVIVASRRESSVASAVEELKKSYPDAKSRISGYTCDLGAKDMEAEIVKLFDFATERGIHKIDHIAETVGEGRPNGGLDALMSAELERAHRVRVLGVLMLVKVGRQYIKPASSSSFTITSGVLVHRPLPGMALLTAMGGEKEGLRKGLAIDLAPIRVNVVSPGYVRTKALESAAGEDPTQLQPFMEMLSSKTLVNQTGTVEDSAEMYVSLMKSHFVTGTVLHVEGGQLLK